MNTPDNFMPYNNDTVAIMTIIHGWDKPTVCYQLTQEQLARVEGLGMNSLWKSTTGKPSDGNMPHRVHKFDLYICGYVNSMPYVECSHELTDEQNAELMALIQEIKPAAYELWTFGNHHQHTKDNSIKTDTRERQIRNKYRARTIYMMREYACHAYVCAYCWVVIGGMIATGFILAEWIMRQIGMR